jgi:hypothetical protein
LQRNGNKTIKGLSHERHNRSLQPGVILNTQKVVKFFQESLAHF